MANTRALYFEWSRRVGGNPSGGENEMSLIRQIARARGVTDAGNGNKTQALRAIAETYGKSSGRQNYLGALRSIVDALDAVPVGYYLGHMNERDCLQAIVGAVEDSTAVDQHLECTAIAGATSSTYELQAADEGFYIRCRVTATNASGSDSAWSNAVGPVEAAPVNPNLVVNPGFETFTGTQDDGTTDTFTGWTNDNGGSATNLIESISTEVHGGVSALFLTRNTAASGVSQDIVVTASTNYRLTFWTRADGTNVGRYSVVDLTNAADIQAFGTTGVAGTSYTLVTLDFATPAGCVLLQLNFYGGSAGSSETYYDDVSLVLN